MSLQAAFFLIGRDCRAWRAKNQLPSRRSMVNMGATVVA